MAELSDAPWASAPASLPDAPWATDAPAKTAPNGADFGWSQAVTDIPHEIGQAAGSALGAMGNLVTPRSSQGTVEHFLTTGRGVLGIPELLASPVTGAARSLLGHGLANAEHAAGTLINPKAAAKDNPAAMYNTAKGDVDTAMSALGARRPVAGPVAPTTEALHDASQANYRNMKGFGVELHPHVMDGVATNIMTELESEGYRDYLTPKTFRAVEELRDPLGQNHTIGDVDGVRKALNKATRDPAERDAAYRAINQIDSTLANLGPADVAVNPHFAGRVAQEALDARANYAAYKRSQQIDEQFEKAANRAASTGSGANVENTMRQNIRAILDNPKKRRGYSDDELAQMRAIVRGDKVTNTARMFGKFAPTGVVSAIPTIGGYLAHGFPGAVVAPVVGFGAKALAEARTAGKVRRLEQAVRNRSPLAAQMPPPALRRANPAGLAVPLSAGIPDYKNPYRE